MPKKLENIGICFLIVVSLAALFWFSVIAYGVLRQ